MRIVTKPKTNQKSSENKYIHIVYTIQFICVWLCILDRRLWPVFFVVGVVVVVVLCSAGSYWTLAKNKTDR